MKKNVVFVTGGAGYIGSHACKVLAKSGFIPVTLDNPKYRLERPVKFGPFEMVDLKNKSNIDNLFIKYADGNAFRGINVRKYEITRYIGKTMSRVVNLIKWPSRIAV